MPALLGVQLLSVLIMLVPLASSLSLRLPDRLHLRWISTGLCVLTLALWAFFVVRHAVRAQRATTAVPQPGQRFLMGMTIVHGMAWSFMAAQVFLMAPDASFEALSWAFLISTLLSSHYHARGSLRQAAWLLLAVQCACLSGAWLLLSDSQQGGLEAIALVTVLMLAYSIAAARGREQAELQRNFSDRQDERACLLQQISHLQEAHSSKSRLLAMVSHDLRQPVHALGLMLGRFRQDASSSSLRIEIEAVNDVVNSLSKSLTMLMAVTRLNSGQVIALPESVSLERLFRSLANEFEETAEASHLQLKFKSNDLSVTTDPNHLRTILVNLISNAIKYTPQGGVKVAATMSSTPGTVNIEVSDSGIGIPAHELQRIFDPFVRLHFRKASVDGIGLGLAIVKQTADLIKSPIQVTSVVGTGTTFSMELPLGQQTATAGTPMPNTYLRGLRIVVIDNDETVLESMARTLEEWGCRVIAANGWDELDVKLGMTVSPVDLILTDFHLDAGFSGYELIKRLRKRHRSQIPAILLTGDVEIRHGPESTATAVVIAYKPLSREKLALLIYDTVSTHAVQPP
ncbi:ATP-binding protein [Hydrogenophaga sp.]|uniref:ATP-binding response regulator n=1 Tax=Hydrogenophaga sp. TaxID=1904254 RepID=UPI003F723157